MTMPDVLDRFLLVTFVSLAAPVLLAAEQASDDSATAAEQLKAALRDQTIIQSNAWLDTEWDQFNGDAKELTWTLGMLWGWHVRDQQDWALRFKLPIVYQRSDQASGPADHGAEPQRYLELSLPATIILPYNWSIGTRYKAKIDFENGDHWTHTADVGV